ncbi:MAG TPA: hypothetical protein VMU06_10140 [Stellaceae bacterium]|nr:hypothetical protein [Stellaceae bacterium]
MQRSRPDSGFLNNGVATEKSIAAATEGSQKPLLFSNAPGQADAQEHDTRNLLGSSENQIAEVLVLGKQQPIFTLGAADNLDVGRTRRNMSDIEHVLTGRAQARHHARINAFID